MKSSLKIALISLAIAAVMGSSSSYTVQAEPSTYCYHDDFIAQPHCGLSKQDCNDMKKEASKDVNAVCIKQEGRN